MYACTYTRLQAIERVCKTVFSLGVMVVFNGTRTRIHTRECMPTLLIGIPLRHTPVAPDTAVHAFIVYAHEHGHGHGHLCHAHTGAYKPTRAHTHAHRRTQAQAGAQAYIGATKPRTRTQASKSVMQARTRETGSANCAV